MDGSVGESPLAEPFLTESRDGDYEEGETVCSYKFVNSIVWVGNCGGNAVVYMRAIHRLLQHKEWVVLRHCLITEE